MVDESKTGGAPVLASFVARIWLERGHNGSPVWRGHIRGVQTDKAAYFQDLGELSAFLKEITGAAGPPLHHGGKTKGRKGQC